MRRARLIPVVIGVVGMMALGLGTPAHAAPGNNGTVKVDGEDILKQSNANEPHVGCNFSIEWYGFDANAVSSVKFETQMPTSAGTTLLTDTVTLDNDDASGGGSPAGLDATAFYTLNFGPGDYYHPIQGYHVKLTVSTTGSQGADTKYKVFWVKDCGSPPPV